MFKISDLFSIILHGSISGLIYTFFIYMYFELDSIYISLAIGILCGLYIVIKEKSEHKNMSPLMTIYFTIPVILTVAPFIGWIFESMFGNRFGYYFGFLLGALISWGYTSYLASEDYYQAKRKAKMRKKYY
ncbi:hypothetical protein [Schinkia azotoformans]|uniref:hypothetical protein n=1 Tax=Schinkia azotoformans TaxID=1454 RepID=UPI002DB8D3CB|nr:hypothetical protein [Schinkia azotoformans]MEC1744116.1 hypothetical protein [Schinkia azotoformans]